MWAVANRNGKGYVSGLYSSKESTIVDVLWISDFGINHNIGGAQRSNDLIIQEGRSQGHIIQAFHHDTDPQALNKSYDLLVSSNLDLLFRQRPDIIDYISTHPNHVRLEHDANRYLPDERRQVLFGNCKKKP